MIRFSLLYLYCFYFIGCTSVSPLEQALCLSGKNRAQLEQVLNHYSVFSRDRLKYKAACFLIENMPEHGWYEGIELDHYKKWVDSTYRDKDFVFKSVLYEAFFQQPDASNGLIRYEDIEHLDSNFLITYIDSTFNAIRKRPWLDELTFEQLCEYILPYRIGNERPRQLYPLQDSLFRTGITDMIRHNNIDNATEIFQLYDPDISKEKTVIKILYRGNHIDYNLSGCISHAFFKSWWAKLLLCPIATDLTPAYPDQNNRHCWSVIINNVSPCHISLLSSNVNTLGKIYRKTYSHNPKPKPQDGEFIPSFFREPFYQDVTSSYNQTEEINIKSRIPVTTAYGYLCVFNDLQWTPVAYTKNKNGVFKFKNIPRDVAYLPVIYPNKQLQGISYPFTIDRKGETCTLQPDMNQLMNIEIKRKYPVKQDIKILNSKFLNSIIEASNDSLFRQKDSIGIFKKLYDLQWTKAQIGHSEKYRYWRIRSNDYFIIAECYLYDQEGKQIKPVLSGSRECLLYQGAFDDNALSYATSYLNPTLQWDMGKRVSLSEIKCLLHNDGNDIWPGHWYELFYHNGTNWKSLGIKKATDQIIEFSEVPANALLWLRNLTIGKEERIFTYQDGKVHFW